MFWVIVHNVDVAVDGDGVDELFFFSLIPHNGKHYIIASENCNPKISLFLIFFIFIFFRVGTETHPKKSFFLIFKVVSH